MVEGAESIRHKSELGAVILDLRTEHGAAAPVRVERALGSLRAARLLAGGRDVKPSTSQAPRDSPRA